MAFGITGSATVRCIDWLLAIIVLGEQGIVPPRSPDARSAQSNSVDNPFSTLCAYAPMSLWGNTLPAKHCAN